MKNYALPVTVRRILVILGAILSWHTLVVAEEIRPVSPTVRTITDAGGRKIDVTIIGKSPSSIKAKRTSDDKEFVIELGKLSEDDRAYISGLTVTPVKKFTVLLTLGDEPLKALLEKSGFDVTTPGEERYSKTPDGKSVSSGLAFLAKISDAELQAFDLIWVNRWSGGWLPGGVNSQEGDRFRDLVVTGKKMVWIRTWQVSKVDFLNGVVDRTSGRAKSKTYIRCEENVIFYWDKIDDWDEKEDRRVVLERHPEILEQTVIKAKMLVEAKP